MKRRLSESAAAIEPPACEHIFVYGTLMGGRAAHRAWPTQSASVTTACVAGAMFDLGPYPAMLRPDPELPKRWVLGEVHHATDDLSGVLASLDAYEDCHPGDEARSLYVRRKVTAVTEVGEVEAWAYYLNDPVAVADCGDRYPRVVENSEFADRRVASWRTYFAARR